MKRHLHLAMGVSAFVLAVCCVAGAGLAWLRAAAGAVARAAMLCTVSEPLTSAPESVPLDLTDQAAPVLQEKVDILWFGATRAVATAPGKPAAQLCQLAPALLRRADCAGPPGDARAGCPALTACPVLAARSA